MPSFFPGSLHGEVVVPGDKSISHRALILGAFAPEPLRITNLNAGRDVLATQEALRTLGARVQRDGNDATVASTLRRRQTPPVYAQGEAIALDCMNSGSTARMLLGLCAGANLHARFDGDASLRRRPMEPVAAQLRAFGARIETAQGLLPLDIRGCERIQTRNFILLSPSAQVKSALLFAGLFGGVRIDISGDSHSRDHTERLFRYHGATVDWDGRRVVLATLPTARSPIDVAGDFSAAAFFITAATIAPGSDILVRNVGVNPTRTGLLTVLRRMGAEIELRDEREACGEPIADVAVRHARLRGIAIGAELALRAIDEIPLLAIAGAFAQGESTISGVADLRAKESDRLAAIGRLLAAVGIETFALPDGIGIRGGSPKATGRPVETRDDHRIAMGAAVLAAAAGPIEVDDASSVDVSFPEFLPTLARARAS